MKNKNVCEIYCNVINVLSVTFDIFTASLLLKKKSSQIKKQQKKKNISPLYCIDSGNGMDVVHIVGWIQTCITGVISVSPAC